MRRLGAEGDKIISLRKGPGRSEWRMGRALQQGGNMGQESRAVLTGRYGGWGATRTASRTGLREGEGGRGRVPSTLS